MCGCIVVIVEYVELWVVQSEQCLYLVGVVYCFFDVDDVGVVGQFGYGFRLYVVIGMVGYVVQYDWQFVLVGYCMVVCDQVCLGRLYVWWCDYQCVVGVEGGGMMGLFDGFGSV